MKSNCMCQLQIGTGKPLLSISLLQIQLFLDTKVIPLPRLPINPSSYPTTCFRCLITSSISEALSPQPQNLCWNNHNSCLFLFPFLFFTIRKIIFIISASFGSFYKLWSESHVQLSATPWTVQSMEFSRPEYWSGSLSLLQGIFPTQASNPGLPLCRQILYQLSHKGSPRILEW